MNHIIDDLNELTKDQRDRLKDVKLMIGTPAYGGMFMGNYTKSLGQTMNWSGKLEVKMERETAAIVKPEYLFGATYIELARNYIANAFWKSDCTHLLFIDADVGWEPKSVFELLLSGKDIIGGLYPRRTINWKAVWKAARAGVPPELLSHCAGDHPMFPYPGKDIQLGFEPQQVLTMPTGFMCISRQTFEIYIQKYPRRKCTPGVLGDFGYQFFLCELREHSEGWGWDGEDNLFCKDMHMAGVDTYFAPWISLSHFGSWLFDGCLPCSMGYYAHIPGLQPQQKTQPWDKKYR